MKKLKRNRGIIHIFIIILGIVIVLVLLGFFNSVQKNAKSLPVLDSIKK